MPLNLIIPMAGKGERFKKAGYSDHKPFIKINEKFMYEYVTKNFPDNVSVWIITCKKYLNESQLNYLKKKKINILFISPHKLGPAYSIMKCKDKLPLNESFFISYCDIDWKWNYNLVKNELDRDGIVFTHNKFHPHKLVNNYAAFCKAKDNQLFEIREKESFTKEWMNEDLSVGIFYIKSGIKMIESIENLVKKKITVSSEYFPSLIFNNLIEKKNLIITYHLNYFIHWGVPENLEDYLDWGEKIKKIKNFTYKKRSNEIVICMGGKGERLKKINYSYKAFIKIFSTPMFKFVCNFFPHEKKTIISNKKIFKEGKELFKGFNRIEIKKQTHSQLDTLKLAIEDIKKKQNFFLISCDAFGFFDFKKFDETLKKDKPDVVIFGFKPNIVQALEKNSHTYISSENNIIKSINIKQKKNKDDLGMAGFFWFSNGKIFNDIEKVPMNSKNEMVVDHFIKQLLSEKKRISVINLKQYIHFGTTNELQEFMFWKENFD